MDMIMSVWHTLHEVCLTGAPAPMTTLCLFLIAWGYTHVFAPDTNPSSSALVAYSYLPWYQEKLVQGLTRGHAPTMLLAVLALVAYRRYSDFVTDQVHWMHILPLLHQVQHTALRYTPLHWPIDVDAHRHTHMYRRSDPLTTHTHPSHSHTSMVPTHTYMHPCTCTCTCTSPSHAMYQMIGAICVPPPNKDVPQGPLAAMTSPPARTRTHSQNRPTITLSFNVDDLVFACNRQDPNQSVSDTHRSKRYFPAVVVSVNSDSTIKIRYVHHIT